MIGIVKRPNESLEIIPTVRLLPRCKACARSLGRKPSFSAVSRTCARVSSRSRPCPLSALLTVPIDTPAASATSRMVGVRSPNFAPALAARWWGWDVAHLIAPLMKPAT